MQANITKSKMDEQKKQLTDRIQQAQNILVAVSANPSVDQLAAAIGLTLLLNKLDKHGTAVFSGNVPSTLEFLKPEATLEKNTDSLRDFIIALDKTKADKLRYKVEDDVVRIFITPYRTNLTEHDLNFSQGDFNVDVVVALGVSNQTDLDGAITAHGRILHDATVASISTQGQGDLGTINWVDPQSSSLSEMVASLAESMGKNVIDEQIATALLTGIVAATDRFSNSLTSPRTMSASAALMAAGANQQLIATELQTPPENVFVGNQAGQTDPNNDVPQDTDPVDAGTLAIDHTAKHDSDFIGEIPDEPRQANPADNQVHVDAEGKLIPIETPDDTNEPQISKARSGGSDGDFIDTRDATNQPELPQRIDTLTANTQPERLDLTTEELSLPPLGGTPLLTHNESVLTDDAPVFTPQEPILSADQAPAQMPPVQVVQPQAQQVKVDELTQPKATSQPPESNMSTTGQMPPAPAAYISTPPPAPPAPAPWTTPADTDHKTLSEIEASVKGHSAPSEPQVDVLDARSAVEAALAGTQPVKPEPFAAIGAQPLGPDLRDIVSQQPPMATALPPQPNMSFSEPLPGGTPADQALDMPLPSSPFGPGQQSGMPGTFTPPVFSPPPINPATSPSAFPGAPIQAGGQLANGMTPPPPVPPPMLPPLQ